MRLSALRSSHGLAVVIALPAYVQQWREQNIIKYQVPTLEARYAVDVEHCLNHDHAIAVATPKASGLLTQCFSVRLQIPWAAKHIFLTALQLFLATMMSSGSDDGNFAAGDCEIRAWID